MAKKKQWQEPKEIIEYLSVQGDLNRITYLEDKQSKYIRQYIRSKPGLKIVATFRRCGLNQRNINLQWEKICSLIREKKVDGVVVANMAAVAADLPDAYRKVGQIIEAGGVIVTVDEGCLSMDIKGAELYAR